MDLGKGKLFQTEIVTGKCPECICNTILIGFGNTFYRCTNCGSDLEQKVNGQISYIPAGQAERFMKSDVAQKG